MQTMTKQRILTALLVPIMACAAAAHAADKRPGRQMFDDPHMLMRVSTSKPENLEAFYSGRGFPKIAIEEINKTCFVTALVKNKTYEVLWLVLDDWEFYDPSGKPIKRIKRSDWKQVWKRIGLKLAHQSTFGWTQLPESRDLHIDEHAGGNVTIPWQSRPFKLVATFMTGPDKSGEPRTLVFENLECRAK